MQFLLRREYQKLPPTSEKEQPGPLQPFSFQEGITKIMTAGTPETRAAEGWRVGSEGRNGGRV